LVAVANRKNQAKQDRLDARAQQIRRQAELEARTRNIVIAIFAVLIIGGAGALYFLTNPPSFLGGNNTSSSGDIKIGEIQTIADEGRGHINSKQPDCPDPNVKYKHNPPSSGCHDPVPSQWGVADPTQPVPATKFVHNLEHGGIVLLYKCSNDVPSPVPSPVLSPLASPSPDASQCLQLAQVAQQIGKSLPAVPVTAAQGQPNTEVKFLATPYQDMQQKAVVLAWTRQEDLADLRPDMLQAITDFYNQFAGKPPSGEPLLP
jgi:hypothetical protein